MWHLFTVPVGTVNYHCHLYTYGTGTGIENNYIRRLRIVAQFFFSIYCILLNTNGASRDVQDTHAMCISVTSVMLNFRLLDPLRFILKDVQQLFYKEVPILLFRPQDHYPQCIWYKTMRREQFDIKLTAVDATQNCVYRQRSSWPHALFSTWDFGLVLLYRAFFFKLILYSTKNPTCRKNILMLLGFLPTEPFMEW